ncbi:MAG: T9SS type A sorting domain-containing protein [Bacteroidota bacterium]
MKTSGIRIRFCGFKLLLAALLFCCVFTVQASSQIFSDFWRFPITADAGPGGSIDPEGKIYVWRGSSISFTITPDKGFEISDVVVDGVSQGPLSSYTFRNVLARHTISAFFVPRIHTITASAGTGGNISPSGEVSVRYGDDRTFTISADYGYEIKDVKVDGDSKGDRTTYTFSDVKSDHEIVATFELKEYIIKAKDEKGGDISPEGDVKVDHGSDQTFTIKADQRYSILDVVVDGASQGALSSYTFSNIQSDHTITAKFAKNTYIITASAGEGGEISPSGEVVVEEDKDKTFTITPDQGYDIDDVFVDGESQGAISEYEFEDVEANHTISATFKRKTYTITPTAGEHGSISPSEATVVFYGSDLEFTISPDAGYGVNNVLVDGESVGKVSSYTFENIKANHSISVTFKKVVRVMDVSIPNVSMKIGDVVTATITVSNDVGIPYTLVSGKVGGYTLVGFKRISAITYEADFTIITGGNSYNASQDIPVADLVITNGDIKSASYKLPIVQSSDRIDAALPVISSMEVEGGVKKIGDEVVLNIKADKKGYSADPFSSINGVLLSAPNVSFSDEGKGNYALRYTVQEGDTDVIPEINELEASVILIKPSGNVGLPYSSISNASELSIDAHAPVVLRMEASSMEVGVGGTAKLTLTADGTGYTPGQETVINGVVLSSPRITFTELHGGLYELSYTVGAEDAAVAPGMLVASVVLVDQAGNVGEAYASVEVNQLEIYTDLPVAAFAGAPELCEGDEAQLTVLLSGRPPWDFILNDGTDNTSFTGVTSTSYQIILTPIQTTTYYIVSVTDVNGVENTRTEEVVVTVNQKTEVEIINLASGYSVTADPVKLEASVPGGTFSGPGVISATGYFYPGIADTIDSPHTISYEFTDANGCRSETSKLVHVLGSEAAILIPASTVCDNEDPFAVTVLNVMGADGSFKLLNSASEEVSGLTDHGDKTATIHPASLGQDTYTIEFQYKDLYVHTISKGFSVESVDSPQILDLSETGYCQSTSPFELLSNLEDVLFEGPGVSGNINEGFMFNPREVEPGPVSIYCTAFSENGCTETTQKEILVAVAPEVKFGISTACIPEGGEIVSFINQSKGKSFVETWIWDFDDPGSGQDSSSNLTDPTHFYQETGPRSITLTATTKEGCMDSFVLDSVIDSKPVADFTWISNCFIKDTDVKFVNRSNYGLALLDTTIWTFKTTQGEVIGEVGSNSPTDTVGFSFTEAKNYQVDMYTVNTGGCFSELSKEIVLSPTVQLDSEGYREDFDASEGLWTIRSEDQVESWVWDVPDFNGYAGEPDNKAWFTSLPLEADGYRENSWIQSPCYDLSGVERPLIRMDIMRSFIPFMDGAVLQYKDQVDGDWKTVGADTPGIEWYNASDILSKPGGSSVGWGLNEFYPDREWVTAVHDLDQVAGETNVVFRVAIASSGKQELNNQGFALDNVRIEGRTKLVVLEHFTDNSDRNSRKADDFLDAMVKAHSKDVIDLQYHLSPGGQDPMSRNNPDPSATRSFNYGVPQIPYTVLDGGMTPHYRYDLSGPEPGPVKDHLRLRTLEAPEFEIDLSVNWLRSGLEATTTVHCESECLEKYIQLYVVVFETSVTAYTGENGDTHFRNVVLDMLPTPAGKLLGDQWRKGNIDERIYTWTYKSYVEDIDDLAVAAFVQDRTTSQILQAAVDYKDETVGILKPESLPGHLSIYPNPAHSTLYVNLGERTSQAGRIEVLDMGGKMMLEEHVPAGYQVIEINVEHLNRGIYILRWIQSGKVSGVSKMVKTR